MTPRHEPRVSRHAIERFRERVYDASDETIIAHILSPRARQWIAAGAETVTVGGLSIRAKHGVVLTVIPNGKSFCRRAGHKGRKYG